MLKRKKISEVKSRKDNADILCSGYLCPLANGCRRYAKAVAWQKAMAVGVANTNVVFQSSTVNKNGRCVYFISSEHKG